MAPVLGGVEVGRREGRELLAGRGLPGLAGPHLLGGQNLLAEIGRPDPEGFGRLGEGEQLVVWAGERGPHGVWVGPLRRAAGIDQLLAGVGVLAEQHALELVGIGQA